eukprot:TRINITY_DN108799_c0_g1_i1.p1 TRINITY_DN108799_c0_g1~~TRINITY_DN108799_c0_g1_i1.p1  ORF type:complete len:199 (+),score=36.31 TRINITY_DN108799_c0_g1_i1:49-597(+)
MGSSCSSSGGNALEKERKRYYFVGEPGKYGDTVLSYGQVGEYVGPAEAEGYDVTVQWAGGSMGRGSLESPAADVTTEDPFPWGTKVHFSGVKDLKYGDGSVTYGQEIFVIGRPTVAEAEKFLKDNFPEQIFSPSEWGGTGVYFTTSEPDKQKPAPQDFGMVHLNSISKEKPPKKSFFSYFGC